MIHYRPFRNTDPPKLLSLYRQVGLSRGAAQPDSVMAFELSTLCLPYFDPAGLIVAVHGSRVVGFLHAGFGFTSDLDALDRTRGVIAAVIVHPEFRRQGIGRELVRRGEEYLQAAGTTDVQAGQTRFRDPFYLGIYGGARPSGFLKTDAAAEPFFLKMGYSPGQSVAVFQRGLRSGRDPTTFRLMALRRQTDLVVSDRPDDPNWWWYCHFANLESMRFQLVHKKSREPVAGVTVIGLDHYISSWNESAIGLVDVTVAEQYRGQGYGQTLLVETLRRLRSELITRAEIHVAEDNPVAISAVQGAGFEQVDTGQAFHRSLEGDHSAPAGQDAR